MHEDDECGRDELDLNPTWTMDASDCRSVHMSGYMYFSVCDFCISGMYDFVQQFCLFFFVAFSLIHFVAQDSEHWTAANDPSEEKKSVLLCAFFNPLSALNMSRRLGHGMDNVNVGDVGGNFGMAGGHRGLGAAQPSLTTQPVLGRQVVVISSSSSS